MLTVLFLYANTWAFHGHSFHTLHAYYHYCKGQFVAVQRPLVKYNYDTFPPASNIAFAKPFPSPLALPVISATLFFKSILFCTFFLVISCCCPLITNNLVIDLQQLTY